MTDNPLKQSIEKRTQDERLRLKREKKSPFRFNIQNLLILSVILGLLFSVFRIIAFFF